MPLQRAIAKAGRSPKGGKSPKNKLREAFDRRVGLVTQGATENPPSNTRAFVDHARLKATELGLYDAIAGRCVDKDKIHARAVAIAKVLEAVLASITPGKFCSVQTKLREALPALSPDSPGYEGDVLKILEWDQGGVSNTRRNAPTQCGLCLDEVANLAVWSCSNGHGICIACVNAAVVDMCPAGSEADLWAGFACQHPGTDPHGRCDARAMPAQELMKIMAPAVFEAYIKATHNHVSTEENKRVMQTQRAADPLHELRLRFAELMCLRCPSCRTVFADWDACAALQCRSCRADFCGLCMEACAGSVECHDHVSHCRLHPARDPEYPHEALGYFIQAPFTVEAAHLMLRGELAAGFIRELPAEQRPGFVAAVAREHADLGLERLV